MQDRYCADPFDAYRPRWKSKLYALLLAGSILGLFGCLCWFGHVAYTL